MKIPLYWIGILIVGMICKHSMTKYLLVEVDESRGSNVLASPSDGLEGSADGFEGSADGFEGSDFLSKPFGRRKRIAH